MKSFKKIVVFDDDDTILNNFKRLFEKKLGVHVDIHSRFDEDKLETIDQGDFVVVDYYLQQDKSHEEIVRKLHKNVECFVLSTSCAFVIESTKNRVVNSAVMKECLNAGANRVCPKDPYVIMDIYSQHDQIRSST